VAAAVLDFFPIEGTRKTVREARSLYERFGRGDRIALVEGYHGHQFSPENQEAALDFSTTSIKCRSATGFLR
jgi:hypothetical protein